MLFSLGRPDTPAFGVKMHFTMPYHPQSNGLVERFHRHLREALRSRLASTDWPHTFRGFSSAYVQIPMRTQASRRQSLYMVALFLHLANFYLPPSRHPALSSANCSHRFPAWQTAPAAPRHRHCCPRRFAQHPLRVVTSSVAGLDSCLPRSLPRQGSRRQILRGGSRWLANGGVCRPPQTTPQEDPNIAGSGPSSRPASPACCGSEYQGNPPVYSTKSVKGFNEFWREI